MREKFVTELVKEVMGPRNGIYEILDENPVNEYITGVLAPIPVQVVTEIDNEAEIPSEDTQTYEDEMADVDVKAPPVFYPALDPKSKPSTMGISFVLEAENEPKIRICLTWARYKTEETKDGKRVWRREPHYVIFSVKVDSDKILWFDESGRQVDNPLMADISFHILVRSSENSRYFVSLWLVNRIKMEGEEFVDTEKYIFQPQIRVVCENGTRLISRVRKRPMGEEEQTLEFLYRKRPVLARGYLCSAIWRDVDPENEPPAHVQLDFLECRGEKPFNWSDGELLPDEERKYFTHPDVRTEFVPIYSIPFPELNWRGEDEEPPELNAGKLSEIWNPRELKKALSPLYQSYEKWINKMEGDIRELNESERNIAGKLIDECRTVLERIKMGAEILCSNDDARLAFCFANKAIALQWRWKHNTEFIWYPFQMAFILMALESIVNEESESRKICDLLWVPTGSGKTEAYLALVVFTMAYRRIVHKKRRREPTGAGVSVITRYTLRLLTIQQFRRALSVITACEYLRVYNLLEQKPVGWRPSDCPIRADFIWGSTPFTIGLWVGGGVSPNKLYDVWIEGNSIPGALNILKGKVGEGEPAQVLNCPACNTILAVPDMGLQPGEHTIYLVVRMRDSGNPVEISQLNDKTYLGITIEGIRVFPHHSPGFFTLELKLQTRRKLESRDIDDLWTAIKSFLKKQGYESELASVRASRPGYFIRYYNGRRGPIEYDFEIFCPNPVCPLRKPWVGGAPSGWIHGRTPHRGEPPDGVFIPLFTDGNCITDIQLPFKHIRSQYISDRIPIPALTVDEQIYRRLPTVVVATVDKFARPPFEPKAGSLFGNVEYHHCVYGYYRQYQPSSPQINKGGHPIPAGFGRVQNYQRIRPLEPPNLIIQDELHLIEGTLGSLVGIYETAIDFLCCEGRDFPVKYLASTATIRRASEQVGAVFLRKLQQFPPHALTVDEKFFITEREIHPLDDAIPGRLYVGICAPGRGPLTPLVRIYARLLQTAWEWRSHADIDLFWTLTGYFNAVRELAGARALYRQDIPQRVNNISSGKSRSLSDERSFELSSRTSSTDLPSILNILNRRFPDAPDVLFTTSMFGTGVDIPRIGLMVVNGQPKTTSAYIQSTGRVGRSRGALVVTFYRATRPRDLSHYEFFVGYHRQIHRFVEPITVYPFSPGVVEKTIGPIGVFILRNSRNTTIQWHREDTARLMAIYREKAPEVQNLPRIIHDRADGQPAFRKPATEDISLIVESKFDKWHQSAFRNSDLKYVEYAISIPPQYPVVLGDYQHKHAGLDIVYENAPRSLRDIEETAGFQT